MERYAVIW